MDTTQPDGMLLPIPRHHRKPGQEGYRTPTIEDVEADANHPQNRLDRLISASEFFQDRSHGHLHSRPGDMSDADHNKRHSHHQPGKDHCNLPSGWTENLNWRQRVKHVTWAYFTLTMATGGIANVLSAVPFRFSGIYTIGLVFFLVNIVLYLITWIMICTRFYLYPYTFKASITHPTESLFVPAASVSFGTILINIVEYGFGRTGTWLNEAVHALFWFDAALAVVLSILIYLLLWSTQYFSVANMTPIWIFPAYPLLIIGAYAGNLSSKITDPDRALAIIIGGFTIQGAGFLVSLTIYAAFVYRLMTQKLPRESLRPGMFVSVGPSAFTATGTINMATAVRKAIPDDYMGDGKMTAQIIFVVGNWMSLWLWGLALWFFFISVLAHWTAYRGRMTFAMTWFSFVFPNTALVTATFAVGKAFHIHAIQVIGCVMTCLLISMWAFVVGMMIRAIFLHQIMWPQKGEDKDEGGFKLKDIRQGGTDEAGRNV